METVTQAITRTFPNLPEIRNSDTRTIGGLVVPFNRPMDVTPKYKESWLPGSINYHERGCFLFWFHKPDQPLASTSTNRLRLEERSDGLYYEADLPDTSLGRDLIAMIGLGEIKGVSPAFKPTESRWKYGQDFDTRNIVKATVGEISLTHVPAYLNHTSVELRNQGGLDEELKRVEERKQFLAKCRQRTIYLLQSKGK